MEVQFWLILFTYTLYKYQSFSLITFNWSLNTAKERFPLARMFPLAIMHRRHSFEGDAIPRKNTKPNKMEKKQ